MKNFQETTWKCLLRRREKKKKEREKQKQKKKKIKKKSPRTEKAQKVEKTLTAAGL